MADNITLDPGVGGAVCKTDDDGVAHWQYVKNAFGADNTQTRVTITEGMPVQNDDTSLEVEGEAAEDAAVSGNPVLVGGRYDAAPRTLDAGDVGAIALDADGAVHVADGGNSLTVDGTITEANSAAIETALEIIDDWDEGDRAKVNPIVGQAGVAAGAGAVGVTVPRVTLADDDPAVAKLGTIDTDTGVIAGDTTSLDGKITACNTGAVTISAALPVGANNIGDVDIASQPADTFVADGGALGKGVLLQGDDGVDRHNVAVDASGRIQVDIAEQSDAADLKVTLDGEAVVLGAGAANIGDVDVLTVPAPLNIVGGGAEATALRVTIANDSTGLVSVDDGGGTLSVDGTVAVTTIIPGVAATNLGKAEDAAHATGDVGVMPLAVREDAANGALGADGDYVPLTTDADGLLRVLPGVKGPVSYANINGVVNGNNTLVAAAGAGNKIRVLSMLLVAHGNVTVIIEDGAAGADLSGPYEFDGANQPKGVSLDFSPVGHFVTTANTLLNMALDAAVRVAGHIVYDVVT